MEDDEYNNWQNEFDDRFENNMRNINLGKERPGRKSSASTKTGLVEKSKGEVGKICPKCQTEEELSKAES